MFLALLLLPQLGLAVDGVTPESPVDQLQAALIKTMKSGYTTPYAERYRALAPVVRSTLDFPFIARLVTGRHWRAVSAAQQAQFIHAFAELSISTYLAQFKSFTGEHWEIAGSEPERGGRVKVVSRLHIGNHEDVSFQYHLHQTERRWRIINILAEGVSDLALKRAEYNTIIKQDGFDKLLARLDEQTRANQAQAIQPD